VSFKTLFMPRRSLIHNLDPRTKLLIWGTTGIPALIANSILISLAMFALTVALAVLGRVSSPYVKNIAKILLPVFVPIFLIQGLFYPAGKTPVLVLLPWLYFRREGIVFAATLLTRLLAIFGGAYLLNLTTHPSDLMVSMQKTGLPLRITYPLFSALQIVPVLESRFQTVKEAQMSRGLPLQNIGILQRFRSFVPLLTPILLGSIEEAYRRSIALEARGFSSKVKKTFLRDPRLRTADVALLALVLVMTLTLNLFLWFGVPRPNPWNL
jgi:energy-coupling factor transport system permease protein